MPTKIICTVTNDLNYDQRMQRICSSLQQNGYTVTLVGVLRKSSQPLQHQIFHQKRIKIFFETSFLFYAEYNIKLFFYLLFTKVNAICTIDLDTIMPCYIISKIKNTKRVYDAHEIFTELNEVVNSKRLFKFWTWVEKTFVPKFVYGYAVNKFMVDEFKKRYNSNYQIVRNIPINNNVHNSSITGASPFIIYQGAVNKGRAFEQLIPAMQHINIPLKIFGIGNYFAETKALITQYKVEHKVALFGATLPNDLQKITPTAWCGITIFEPKGLNQIQSLANRFFDYMMAGIPQICINYPEYKIINDEYNFCLMINDTNPETIANAIFELEHNKELYRTLKKNTLIAREKLNWQNEEKKLIEYWKNICI